MRVTRRFATLIVAAMTVVAGCIPSLHPIYTDEDIVFDEALLGEWSEPGEDETWSFTRPDEEANVYRLVHSEGSGKSGAFVVHLVKVKDHLFLDLYPEEPELESAGDFYKRHLVKVHTFMHVHRLKPKLQLAVLDVEWLEQHLDENPGAIDHEIVEGDIVLTAPTRALQDFFVKHLSTPDAYDEPSEPMDRNGPRDVKADLG